jgi:hypothetical protein
MVRGLEKFKTHFANFKDQYVLIGGTASSVVMDNAGLEFRGTKDLDIVLCVEAMNKDFGNAFSEFIQDGQYSNKQKSTGKDLFYRFDHPEDKSYPMMLELFAREPGTLPLRQGTHLTPVPIEAHVSSLSAILLNDDYYNFIHENKIILDDLSIVNEKILIPLKARAWLDLLKREEAGDKIPKNEIKKHINDVIRLYQLLSTNRRIHLPDSIAKDLISFVEQVRLEKNIDLKNLGLRNTNLDQVLADLELIYSL